MPLRFLFVRLLLPGAVLMSATPAWTAWPNNPISNVPVCTAAGDQWNPVTVSDGAGGVVIAWYDWRSGTADVYAQRLNQYGVAQWTAGGVQLCGATGDQTDVRIVGDGSGGAIVSWVDSRVFYDLYAQRVSAVGVPLWTANGVIVCDGANRQEEPAMVADGAGGAILAWQDGRGGHASNYDIYAQRLNGSGAAQWTANGVLVASGATSQLHPAAVGDGAGGVVVAWTDNRSATGYDVYAQRLDATGVAQWAANGVALCAAAGDQGSIVLAQDGTNGAIAAWVDPRGGNRDLYAQRVNGPGGVLWTANGVAVCTATGDQWNPAIRPDGASGAILAWFDWRNGNADLYAQHLDNTGAEHWDWWVGNGKLVCDLPNDQTNVVLATDDAGGTWLAWQDARSNVGVDVWAACLDGNGVLRWAGDARGTALSSASGDQTFPALVADGAGNAIVAWMDQRGADRDIYAQRVDKWGTLGAQPAIVRVKDVPNDQGNYVTLYWTASPYDSFPVNYVSEYRVYRRDPGQTAWTLTATQAAQCLPGYSLVRYLSADSTGAGNPRTSFRVEAYSVSLGGTWTSDPDSGYSVDNLSPPVPAPFSGTYEAGTATLAWGPSEAPDLAGYRLYRVSGPDAVPQEGDLVAAPTGTGYVDAAGAPFYYRLAAVDVHGNASAFATLLPAGAAGVPGGPPPREPALSPPAPNPARETTTLRLALPRDTRVRLVVFDQQGRSVRTLAAGELPAGERAFTWDGRDDGGHPVPSALYFVRLQAEGRTITRRLAVVR
jgi:hypothetical protein